MLTSTMLNWGLTFRWDELAAALVVAGGIWGAVIWMLRGALSKWFITRGKFRGFFDLHFADAAQPMTERIAKLEGQLARVPTSSEVKDIERRVEKVEVQLTEVQRTVTQVQVGVAGLQQGQQGISRQVDNVMNHLLAREKP